MILCKDCGKWIPDDELMYCSLDKYDDEPDCFCPYCESDQLVEVEDDPTLRVN